MDSGKPAEGGRDGPLGIQQVARELGISQRTLRFYEDKGLIASTRIGTMRVYSRRELGRMRLILRGKRLGFSLREISEFLDLYDVDPSGHEQMRALDQADEYQVTALAKCSLGTRLGVSAWAAGLAKAREAPMTMMQA